MSLEQVRAIFDAATFVRHLGIELVECAPGICKTRLHVKPEQMQQHGFVHACVVAALADHSSGGAATTVIKDGETVITVEFKINFLRPAVSGLLTCTSNVLKAGKSVVIAESEVFAVNGGSSTSIAKGLFTLVVRRARVWPDPAITMK